MAVGNVKRLAGPFAGAGTKILPFGFKIFEPTDVFVALAEKENDPPKNLEYNADYSVEMNQDQEATPGGTVTLTNALNETQIVSVGTDIPYTQTTQLTNYIRFPPETINTALDRTVVQIQQLVEQVSRALITDPTDTITPRQLRDKLLAAVDDAIAAAGASKETLAACEAIKGFIERYSWDIPHLVNSLEEVEAYPYDGYFWVKGYGNPGNAGEDISNRLVGGRTLAQRFGDVISAKDFGAKGDGVTDDTEALTTLESKLSGRVINLMGLSVKVDKLPTKNKYINGKFLVDGIYYPTDDYYDRRISLVSPDNGNYNAWPQDTAHTYRGALFSFYTTDVGHNSDEAHPVLAISTDGGNTFPFQQHLGVDKTFGQMVASAGVTDAGCQLAVMRQGKGTDYAANKTYRLLARRLFEYIAFATDTRTLQVSTTSGFSQVVFTFSFPHGLTAGDTLTFEYTGNSVGGITVDGEFIVDQFVSATVVKATKTNGATAATSTASGQVTDGGLRFNEYAKFRELKVGGVPFGTALKNLSGVSTNPAMAHSMCIVDDDVYLCIHGGGYQGTYIVKISNVSQESRSVSMKQITTYGTEGTLAHLGGRVFIGGIRTESIGYPARFFLYDEAKNWVHANDTRFGKNRFLKSPLPVRVVGDYVVFCFSENRATRPLTTERFVGKVPIYIAYARKDDLLKDRNTFEDKLVYEKVSDAFYANTSIGDGSGAGVPSLTAIGSNLFLFYSSEHPAVIADRDGYPNVYCCRLDFYSVLGNKEDSPIDTLHGYMTTAHDGINRNYSTPDWQDIPFNITLYFGSKTTSSAGATQGLSAEFSDSAAEAMLYFTDERKSGPKRFSIGHNYYRVKALPVGSFKNEAQTNEGVGIAYAPIAGKTGTGFKIVCRMNSKTNLGTIEYGYGTVDVSVQLEKPVNWLETE